MELHSGIAPLDEELGGLIPGRLHLLTGGPGTGKSTACYHFLKTGIRLGEPVALLTIDRVKDLASHMRCVRLDLGAAVRNRQLGVLRFRADFARHLSSSASPYRAMDDLWTMIVDIKPTRLVIDPVSPFLTESTASGAAIAALAQLLDGFGVTTLLTYPGDVSAGYDARLNSIVQRAALIVHLERDEAGGHHMQIVQSRTRTAPSAAIRYVMLPDAGIVRLNDDRPAIAVQPVRLPAFLEITRTS